LFLGNEFSEEDLDFYKNNLLIGSISNKLKNLRNFDDKNKENRELFINLKPSIVDEICGLINFFINSLKKTKFLFIHDSSTEAFTDVTAVNYINSLQAQYQVILIKDVNDYNKINKNLLKNIDNVIISGNINLLINSTILVLGKKNNKKIN
jgi:hypothetical protein